MVLVGQNILTNKELERRCALVTKALGQHLIVDLYGCDPKVLDDLEFIKKHMIKSAEVANSTVINSTFHRFCPCGVSGVVVIAESDITIHTWPEYGYAAIDIFTCGEKCDPWKAFEHLRQRLQASSYNVKEMKRGVLQTEVPVWRQPQFIKQNEQEN